MDINTKFLHICEVCGKEEMLTAEEAFIQGWDYPPTMGAFGVVSPRTCGDCPIDRTLYWKIIGGVKIEDLSEHDKETLKRIMDEIN